MHETGAAGVLALVIYAGSDTKLVLNQGKYKYKTSNTEIDMNYIFVWQVVQIVTFCTLYVILHSYFLENHRDSEYLYEGIESDALYNLTIFLSFWGIMMRYIPLDVILQTETAKIVYSQLMQWDMRMSHFDPELNQLIHCQVQSMQLPDALS